MRDKVYAFFTNIWAVFAIGVVLGALLILAIRFATYRPEQVHYHANFAVYIEGKREAFKGPRFYEEVATCQLTKMAAPAQRAHLHNNENAVIHVHDNVVTWGQFFANIGWTVGNSYVSDGTTLYMTDSTKKASYILNGKDVTGITDIANTVIRSHDRLLVSYGETSGADLTKQYETIPANAGKYNASQDPSACAGSHEVTFTDRLKHLF